MKVMAANIATPARKPTMIATETTRLRSNPKGTTGSTARRSIHTNATKSAAVTMARSALRGVKRCSELTTSSKSVTAAVSTAAPA